MHLIEAAKSGRASCRSCKKPIGKGELRLGEEVPNAFADGAPTHVWHHLDCAATKKPDVLVAALEGFEGEVPNRAELLAKATEAAGKQKPKVPYAERAPTGRSRCLSCEEAIAKDELRVAVEREVDTGSFVTKSAGYLHVRCAAMFVGDPDLWEEVKAHSRGLAEADLAEVEKALKT
ncbi:MAG: hypothetical protein HYV07_02115 [Deltaproteobacteria bacterium]|nr:hypothetical protein [Deltaproteobacteria bacterium]